MHRESIPVRKAEGPSNTALDPIGIIIHERGQIENLDPIVFQNSIHKLALADDLRVIKRRAKNGNTCFGMLLPQPMQHRQCIIEYTRILQ